MEKSENLIGADTSPVTRYLGNEPFNFFKDLLAIANFLGARIFPFNLFSSSLTVNIASCLNKSLLKIKICTVISIKKIS